MKIFKYTLSFLFGLFISFILIFWIPSFYNIQTTIIILSLLSFIFFRKNIKLAILFTLGLVLGSIGIYSLIISSINHTGPIEGMELL